MRGYDPKLTKGEAAICALLLLVAIGLCVGVSMVWNERLYGDWRCAFAQCRLEK